MNLAEKLAHQLSEVEKIDIRRSTTESQIVARYHDHKRALTGSLLNPGSEEDGIAEMKQVRDILNAEFDANSAMLNFGRQGTK